MAAAVVVELTADEKKLLQAYQKLERSNTDLKNKLKELQQASKQAAKQQEDGFKAAFNSSVSEMAKFAAGYVGIQQAIALVNDHLQNQVALLQKARDTQLNVATGQQEAIKNFTGISAGEQRQILEVTIPDIAVKTAFADLKAMTDAFGAGVSASGDIEATKSAVEVAANLTRLRPEDIGVMTAGALDIARASGKGDANENMAFALSAASFSRVPDPAAFMKNLAPSVSNAVATVPQQDRARASIEAGAIFSALTRGVTDVSGDQTKTALTQLTAKLGDFFAGEGTDPGTILGRIEALQKDSALRDKFLANPFGEAAFQQSFKAMFDSRSGISKDIQAGLEGISFDKEVTAAKIEETKSLTGSIGLATAQKQIESSAEVMRMRDFESAARGQVQATLDTVLPETRRGGIGGFRDSFRETGINLQETLGMTGGSAAEEASAGIMELLTRRQAFAAGGVTQEEQGKITLIDQSIVSLERVLGDLARFESIGRGNVEAGSTKEAIDYLLTIARENSEEGKMAGGIAGRLSEKYQQEILEEQKRQTKALEKIAGGPTPMQASDRGAK